MSNRPSADQRLFIKKTGDYQRVKREGRRIHHPFFNVMVCPNGGVSSRVGIVVGRRFGNAVMRNRAKRRIREMVRRMPRGRATGVDVVVFPRRLMLEKNFHIVDENWRVVLHRIGMLPPVPDTSCPVSFSG